MHRALVVPLVLCVACEVVPPAVLSESSFVARQDVPTVPPLVVEETILRHDTLHDPRIERRYVVVRGAERLEIGGFEDEASDGISHEARVQAGVLVVLSASRVGVVRGVDGPLREAETSWFLPYDVPCFAERATPNGFYDIVATRAEIRGREWRLTYQRHPGASESVPSELAFRSSDGGRTFAWEGCPVGVDGPRTGER